MNIKAFYNFVDLRFTLHMLGLKHRGADMDTLEFYTSNWSSK